jgi:hypothetical protein
MTTVPRRPPLLGCPKKFYNINSEASPVRKRREVRAPDLQPRGCRHRTQGPGAGLKFQTQAFVCRYYVGTLVWYAYHRSSYSTALTGLKYLRCYGDIVLFKYFKLKNAY